MGKWATYKRRGGSGAGLIPGPGVDDWSFSWDPDPGFYEAGCGPDPEIPGVVQLIINATGADPVVTERLTVDFNASNTFDALNGSLTASAEAFWGDADGNILSTASSPKTASQ